MKSPSPFGCHVFLTLSIAALAAAGCGKPPAREPQRLAVQAVKAESLEGLGRGSEPAYIAIIRAEDETDLGFKVPGIVDVIGPNCGTNWGEGTAVKAGDLLASLKQSDFTNALNSARAEAELTTKVWERFSKLRASDAISQQELDVTEAKWRTAQAQLDQAAQNVRDSQLRAPIDGLVLARYVNPGATVAAGQRVLRFAGFSTMSVELGVPDRAVNFFSPGKKVPVEISALEGEPPFMGTVSEVGVAANAESRLFRVVLKVSNPKGIIRSGMTATVRVSDPARIIAGLVRVPLSALVTFAPEARGGVAQTPSLAVFVVESGKAKRREIRTGDILNSSVIVLAGLKAGEEVVTAGSSFLYDGAPVSVLNAGSNPE